MIAQQKIDTEFIYQYDIGERREPKTLTMEIHPGKFYPLLHFVGGPTGYETYELSPSFILNLFAIRHNKQQFCICAGTKNSWPKCSVDTLNVLLFLSKNKHHLIDSVDKTNFITKN
jgi:hypothetical protein